MFLLTVIAKVTNNGQPMTASIIHENEQVDYHHQAKTLFETLTTTNQPIKCSMESENPYLFHFVMTTDTCFLTLCDEHSNKQLAHAFLEDISQEFYNQNKADHTMEFEDYIQKTKKTYLDNRICNFISCLL